MSLDKEKWILIGLISGILVFLFYTLFVWDMDIAGATQNPYKIICHHTPANNVTLTFQNQQSYNGHLGTPHSGSTYDTDGACRIISPTPSITIAPTNTPSVTPTVTPTAGVSATPTPSLTPVPTDTPRVTPTPTVTQNNTGDHVSDNRSDGRSSCPECTAQPTLIPLTWVGK